MQKTPVTIIAGFLGSGKTTLLNWILNSDHGLRIAVLVNDFGEVNIDSQLITNVEGETISLANGCVCCTIRDDLAKAVMEICDREEPPDYIVTETSGVSEPAAAAMGLLMPPELSARIQIDSIITVVDAEQVLDLDESNKHLAVDQIEAADIIVLNKTDLVSGPELDQVKEWLDDISPQSRVVETTYCEVPLALIINTSLHSDEISHQPHEHEDHGSMFTSWSWLEDRPLSFQATYEMFKTLPLSVFRSKGILNFNDVPDKRVILQMVGKRVTLTKGEPWNTTPAASQIVMIANRENCNIDSLKERFQSCIAENAVTEQNRMADAVIEILRS